MEVSQLKELAKKVSKDVLFDSICNHQFSEDELVIFREEVIARGLQEELTEAIKANELSKARMKEGVNNLSKEYLFHTIINNPHKFTEKELLIFKNQVNQRGLGKELAATVAAVEADGQEFKATVLDTSNDVIDLLGKFNDYAVKKYPVAAKYANGNEIKKRKNSPSASLMVGVAFILMGVVLTLEVNMFFGSVVLAGIAIVVRGMITSVKS